MGCDICQQIKNCSQQSFKSLIPNKMPNGSWEIISTNLITQLPGLNSYNAIYVIIDRLTKRAHFISINNQLSSKNIVQLLFILYIGYLYKLSQIEKCNIWLNSSKNGVNY